MTRLSFFLLPLLVTLGPLAPDAHAQRRDTLIRGKTWNAYKIIRRGRRVCYVEGAPRRKHGAEKKRTDPYVQVMHRLGLRGRKRDVVDIGFFLEVKVKPAGPVAVKVGRREFKLVARDNRAFAPNDKENRRLLRAMILGKTLVLRGQAATGERFADIYALAGFSRAYYAARAACGLKVPNKGRTKTKAKKNRRG